MRILIVSQYFWPESFIINDLVKTLVSQGIDVHVLTGKPNYPDGEIFPGYKAKGSIKEYFDKDVPVYRIPVRPRNKGGSVNLTLNYLSFVFYGLLYSYRLIKNQSYDAILVFAPSPITQAIPAIYLKWRFKCHLAIWVQDIWPESLLATGFIRNKIALKLVGYMVKVIYLYSDTLLVQSKAFEEPVSIYTDKNKIEYYPNSILANNCNEEVALPKELKNLLENNFCVVFAGNIGKAQSVETILEAANRLKEVAKIKFVFVGSGSMLDWVSSQKEKMGLSNVVIAGRFQMDAMPSIYQYASALLVTLKDEETFSKTIPSKLQAYLEARRPIIASLNGEGARVVNEAGAGLTCKAEDANALAQCVRDIYALPENDRLRMGASGYAYFLDHFEMNRQAKLLIELLEKRILQSRSSS